MDYGWSSEIFVFSPESAKEEEDTVTPAALLAQDIGQDSAVSPIANTQDIPALPVTPRRTATPNWTRPDVEMLDTVHISPIPPAFPKGRDVYMRSLELTRGLPTVPTQRAPSRTSHYRQSSQRSSSPLTSPQSMSQAPSPRAPGDPFGSAEDSMPEAPSPRVHVDVFGPVGNSMPEAPPSPAHVGVVRLEENPMPAAPPPPAHVDVVRLEDDPMPAAPPPPAHVEVLGLEEAPMPEAPPPPAHVDVFGSADSSEQRQSGTQSRDSTLVSPDTNGQLQLDPQSPPHDEENSFAASHLDQPDDCHDHGSNSQAPRPFNLVSARMPEGLRGIHDTPHQKHIYRGDTFLQHIEKDAVTGMPHFSIRSPIANDRYDIGLAYRTPQPDDWENHDVTHEEWAASKLQSPSRPKPRQEVVVEIIRHAKDLSQHVVGAVETRSTAPSGLCSSRRRPPFSQALSRLTSAAAQSNGGSDNAGPMHSQLDAPGADEEYTPPARDQLDDDGSDAAEEEEDPSEESSSDESRPAKGKAKAQGRPTTQAAEEIDRVGHRIQAELVALADKLGLSYATLLKKIGFAGQEVREPTLANVFRQVHKHRLLAKGLGMYSRHQPLH